MSDDAGIFSEPIPFGRYYLLERISTGGMAEIFKAKAFGVEGFERLLAVKRILGHIAENEEFIDMFIDEAKIAGQLHHPNIAQIFDLGRVEGSYFIALEYISGQDLKTLFQRNRRLDQRPKIPRIIHVVTKVCEGLAHAHGKKDSSGRDLDIVHRDISPQNILLSYEGEVKIIDFGIAKAKGRTSETEAGVLKGKFSYMSPEQVEGEEVDHRCDLFSLGIVLYEMLTRRRLFRGSSDVQTIQNIQDMEIAPPSTHNPEVSDELDAIVMKALARPPGERFQTARQMEEALERYMRHEDFFYKSTDLAEDMRAAFSDELKMERRKLEYYRSLDLEEPEGSGELSREPTEDGPDVTWDERDVATGVFEPFDEQDPSEQTQTLTEADIIEEVGDSGETTEPMESPEVAVDTADERRPGSSRATDDEESKTRWGVIAALLVLVGAGAMFALNPTWVDAARERLSGFSMAPGQAEITFTAEAEGIEEVEIQVNGEVVHRGPLPHTHRADPGETEIVLSREGYEPERRTQTLEADQEYTFKADLGEAIEEGPDPETKASELASAAGASVAEMARRRARRVQPDPAPEPKPDPTPEPKPRPEPEPEPTQEPEPEPKPEPKPNPEPEPEPEPEPKGDSEPASQTATAAENDDSEETPPGALPPSKMEADPGFLKVASRPAARVIIDGEDTGQHTPLIGHELSPGTYSVTLKNENFGLDKTYSVTIESGETETIINRSNKESNTE
jgi:serine/threonine protein kinase